MTKDKQQTMLDNMLELVWPKRCVGCERLGELFCPDCLAEAPIIERAKACPRCGAPFGSLICSECYSTAGQLPLSFSAAVSAYQFEGAAARLVTIYKDQHEQRLAAVCAERLAEVIPPEWLVWAEILSYVPADSEKLRQRGFDHMRLVAEHLAELLGLEQSALLHKKACDDQRLLNREQRLANLQDSISCPDPSQVAGQNILLIDDVMTTTATLQAAAAALIAAQARELRVATICRVY